MTAWTAADAAELDLLIFEFVHALRVHQERCSICSSGPSCSPIREAYEAVVYGRKRLELCSLAARLRAHEDVNPQQPNGDRRGT